MNTPSNPRFSVVPQAGTPLGPNWQKEAKLRALTAEQHYRHTLENAWRQGNEGADPNIARSARLSSNSRPITPDEQAMRNRLSSNHKPIDWNDLTGQR